MTIDAGSQGLASEGAGLDPLQEGAEAAEVVQSEPVGETKKERPNSLVGLIEYAYSEAGRKLHLARKDLRQLSVDAAASQAEVAAVRRLAADDPLLAVPLSLLVTLAEHGASMLVRHRILELVHVAFASHKLFEGKLERLTDPTLQPVLTAREVSDNAQSLTFDALGYKDAAEFKGAARERLRVNAVTAFGLFRVIRDRWTSDQFVDDMAALVWNVPMERSAPRMAASLAAARSTDALSQLSRHFEVLLEKSRHDAESARALTAQQVRRAEAAEASNRSLIGELDAERARVAEALAQVDESQQRLSAEQSSRVVDKSHLVSDYEALRTQVIRRLTAQADLLRDGLHALRNGSTGVAEEFIDRAVSAITGEVARLKEPDGEFR